MLGQLLNNIQKDEEEEKLVPNSERDEGSCESAKERILWALTIVSDQEKAFQSLLEDLRLATQAVSIFHESQLYIH